MKIPESIAVVLFILGVILILSGTAQKGNEVIYKEVNNTEQVLINGTAQNMNSRQFIGILCLIGCVGSIIAGAGLSTVRSGSIVPSES